MTLLEVKNSLIDHGINLTDTDIAFFCSIVDGDVARTVGSDTNRISYEFPTDETTVLLVYEPYAKVYFNYCVSQYYIQLRQYTDYQNYAEQYNALISEFKADYRITEIQGDNNGTLLRVKADMLSRRNKRVRSEEVCAWSSVVDADISSELNLQQPGAYNYLTDMSKPLIAQGSYFDLYFYYCIAMQELSTGGMEQYKEDYEVYLRLRGKFLEHYRSKNDVGVNAFTTPSAVSAVLQSRRPALKVMVSDIAYWCAFIDRQIYNRTGREDIDTPTATPDTQLLLQGADIEVYVSYCSAMLLRINGDQSQYADEMQRYEEVKKEYILKYLRYKEGLEDGKFIIEYEDNITDDTEQNIP